MSTFRSHTTTCCGIGDQPAVKPQSGCVSDQCQVTNQSSAAQKTDSKQVCTALYCLSLKATTYRHQMVSMWYLEFLQLNSTKCEYLLLQHVNCLVNFSANSNIQVIRGQQPWWVGALYVTNLCVGPFLVASAHTANTQSWTHTTNL